MTLTLSISLMHSDLRKPSLTRRHGLLISSVSFRHSLHHPCGIEYLGRLKAKLEEDGKKDRIPEF
jgi:hypothetical protein